MNLQDRFDQAPTEHMLAILTEPRVEKLICQDLRRDYRQQLFIGGCIALMADFEVEFFDRNGEFVVKLVYSWDEIASYSVDAAVAELADDGYEIPSSYMDNWVYLDNLCQEVLK